MYVVAFLDRVNVGFAKQHLQQAMVLAYGTVRDLLVVAQVLVRLELEQEVPLLEFW